jgi:hypothetical protein
MKKTFWDNTSIAPKGVPLAEALVPALEAWIERHLMHEDGATTIPPAEIAALAEQIVLGVCFKNDLFRKYNTASPRR